MAVTDFKPPSFADLTEVRFLHSVKVHGIVVPSGARGVVMAVFPDGLANEVEFEEPDVVITLEADDLRA